MFQHLRNVLFSLFVLASFAGALPVRAGQEFRETVGDSVLKNYYYRVRRLVNSPEVLPMCDTLFRRAGEQGWTRMQATALCLRLDHFYYNNDREGILDGVRRVQDFCVENGRKDLAYFYYFVWGSRLVTYYTKQKQFNVAVYETRRMLSEAQADDYPFGEAECYRLLANLYLIQNTFDRAYDYFRQELNVMEEHGIDDINLPTQYASLAQCALELDMPDSARMALDKGRALRSDSPYQRFTLDKGMALYYLHIKDFDKAGAYVDSAAMHFAGNSSMRSYLPGLRFLRTEYYRTTGRYDKALETVHEALSDSLQREGRYLYYTLYKELGNIHWLRGDMRRSAANYRDYIHLSDSVRSAEIRNGTDDFSGILEIARLQGETRELQLDLQQKRLRSTYLIIALLGGVLVLGGLGLARLMRLNRRLKASEEVVKAQNKNLMAVGEELRMAKERAEQASLMKSNFIQSMSHEVRTPLNSIMGFSQVLVSKFRNDPTVEEYVSIIETSSLSLLRMVDDVLDIAYLDQTEELPRTDYCTINDRCHECVAKSLSQLRAGVTMIFEPSAQDPVLHTNSKRVMQVLLHLLHNAAKFTVEGEIILTYTCRIPERTMLFTVSDTGPGIPAGEQEQVFERFVKLDTFAQGTGLGLPVCRLIATKLGGSLRVDSSYTVGCRMIFEVPFGLPDEI